MARLRVTEDGQWIVMWFKGFEFYLKRADFPLATVYSISIKIKESIFKIKEIDFQKIYCLRGLRCKFCGRNILIKATG